MLVNLKDIEISFDDKFIKIFKASVASFYNLNHLQFPRNCYFDSLRKFSMQIRLQESLSYLIINTIIVIGFMFIVVIHLDSFHLKHFIITITLFQVGTRIIDHWINFGFFY